jgi:hypothetical protein
MLKRVTWFTVGTVVGATGTVVGYLRARELARRHVPENVRDAATRAVGIADSGVRVAIDRGFVLVDGLRTNAETTRQTRKQTEHLLRQQLERAGL